ncbi:hypothetical protein [Bacillus sp. FJAT-27245]|uniref:hypothetical protein n=1 Tax=Bacillus sp. FJAT-27245 TaxID=1684144 RepID=UPI0006A7B38D|nr:hypothetical protein [Bacillus sp. FJAT-27245]
MISAPGISLSAGLQWSLLGAKLLLVELQRLAPRGRFGPSGEVKERLLLQALQRLSGLTKALSLFHGSPLAAQSRRTLNGINRICPRTKETR